MSKKAPTLTPTMIQKYIVHLKEQERSASTIQKYTHDLNELLAFLNGAPVTKTVLIDWKQRIADTRATSTVNSMLVAVNGFLSFMGWRELTVKPLKMQKSLFLDENRELTRAENVRLVQTAKQQNNERLSLVIQTICATGIRVSELRCITAEAVCTGRAEVNNKGKRRVVFRPDNLRHLFARTFYTLERDFAGGSF